VEIKDQVFSQNIFFAEPFQVLRIYSMDITRRKQMEEKLREALLDLERSNRDLEEFAYISSHDLQEPLRKIANFSEMLVTQYQGRLDEQAERHFGYIIDGAKRMQALINDLLSYSRVGRAELTLVPASLEEILKGTLSNLQALIQESGAEISYDPLPTLQVNPHQMGQLLQNLITNGIKFHDQRAPRIHLSARQEGQEWVIAVQDHGIGFDPQYVEGIFKVFKRLHSKEQYPGTGIGLAICKKIAERHGGRIWAESEPGRGATFYFTIPA
jgi:light-regulated signal transduction histidine kinase (bacteriophytochrome)